MSHTGQNHGAPCLSRLVPTAPRVGSGREKSGLTPSALGLLQVTQTLPPARALHSEPRWASIRDKRPPEPALNREQGGPRPRRSYPLYPEKDPTCLAPLSPCSAKAPPHLPTLSEPGLSWARDIHIPFRSQLEWHLLQEAFPDSPWAPSLLCDNRTSPVIVTLTQLSSGLD